MNQINKSEVLKVSIFYNPTCQGNERTYLENIKWNRILFNIKEMYKEKNSLKTLTENSRDI